MHIINRLYRLLPGLLPNSLVILLLLLLAYSMFILDARAVHNEPTTYVNINEQTNLFEESVTNWSDFQNQLNQQKEGAISGIKAEKGLDSLVKEDRGTIQKEANNLASIKASDLSSLGAKEMQKDESISNLYIDYTRDLNKNHWRDAGKIANAQDGLLSNLLDKIREIGVDCKTVRGDKIKEPKYYLQMQEEKHKDTVYNQTICEELRNQYRCNKKLSLYCTNPTSKNFTKQYFTSNLPIAFERATGQMLFGSDYPHALYGGNGQKFDYYINFTVTNKEELSEFMIKNIYWDDHIRITINGKQVFMGPFSGDRLTLGPAWWRGWRSVIVDNSGKTYPSELNTWHGGSVNIDLRQYLQNGNNQIAITLIVGGHGGVLLRLKAGLKDCANWQESWQEDCYLQ